MIPITAIPVSFQEMLSLTQKLVLNNLFDKSKVTEFENKLADYVGSKRILACNSGRTALYLAMQALGLNQGDEVIVPAYNCAIVFEMIWRAGLKPVFVDVRNETCNLDPGLISEAVTSKTKAIVPVHLFGRPCDMDAIAEEANKHGLYVVEDVAQALGAEYKGKKVGSFGDLAVFSFGPGKSITGGEGGAIAVNNSELLEMVEGLQSQLPSPNVRWKVRTARNILAMRMFSNRSLYGVAKGSADASMEKTDEMIIQNCLTLSKGMTSPLEPSLESAKMPETSAAVIVKQLERLDDFNGKRIMNAQKLLTLLKTCNEESIQLPKTDPNAKNSFTRFPIRIVNGNRALIIKEMLRRGVDTRELYYYIADLLHAISKARFPNAEVLSDCLVALPNHPLLTVSDIEEIASSFVASLQVA